MADRFSESGYRIISDGTDNHLMLINLSNKNISGKDAEEALGKAEITVNKNMVPFDEKSPAVTSGMRIGTPAITTRGLKEDDCRQIVDWIDLVLTNPSNNEVISRVRKGVNEMMSGYPLYPEIQ